jgi:hypothetical protein
VKAITDAGIELKSHVFALDGVAVLVSPQNPIKTLSLDQIAKIFAGRSRIGARLAEAPVRSSSTLVTRNPAPMIVLTAWCSNREISNFRRPPRGLTRVRISRTKPRTTLTVSVCRIRLCPKCKGTHDFLALRNCIAARGLRGQNRGVSAFAAAVPLHHRIHASSRQADFGLCPIGQSAGYDFRSGFC